MDNLPTTAIALIAFIFAGSLGSTLAFLRYIQWSTNKFSDMLTDQSNRHENILKEANSRLDNCMRINLGTK